MAPERDHPTLAADFLDFGEKDRRGSVQARFEKIAGMVPDSPAILTLDRSISYLELDRAANRIANNLLSVSGSSPEPILSLASFGAESIAHLLGIFKAGKIFVALDPSFPAVRHRRVLVDSQARFILTNEEYRDQAAELIGADDRVIVVEDPFLDASSNQSNRPNEAERLEGVAADIHLIQTDSIAGIFYTSGSTGEPKGVLASHRSLLTRISYDRESYKTSPGDRQLLVYSLSFQASMTDILGALLNGGAVCPFNLRTAADITFERWLREIRITILRTSVSIFRRLLDDLPGPGSLPDVRIAAIGGAKLYQRDYETFRQLFPGARLMHRLASAETGLVTRSEIDDTLAPRKGYYPTGCPVPGVRVTIVDDDRAPLPAGAAGEIAVNSANMTPGYWKQPEKTLEKFHPDPDDPGRRTCFTGDLGMILPNGALQHLGRKDFMVKVRGYRVEIPEIESALFALESVKQAVVLPRMDSIGEQQLVAYCIPAGKIQLNISDIRNSLSQNFPDYMLPSRLVVMDEFPMNTSTKVDRRALPDPDRERPELRVPYKTPKNSLEGIVANIWAEVLELDRVGVADDFFDLGGNSLLALKILTKIEHQFEQILTPAAFYEGPTIAHQASLIQGDNHRANHLSLVPIKPAGGKLPVFCVHGKGGHVMRFTHLARALDIERPFYGLQSRGTVPGHTPHRDFTEMVDFYISEIRTVQEHGPYHLGGLSGGGLIAFEMARKLRAEGDSVDVLFFLDSDPTGYKSFRSALNPLQWARFRTRKEIARATYHYSNLRKLGANQRWKYLRRVTTRLRGSEGPTFDPADPPPQTSEVWRRWSLRSPRRSTLEL